jgi:hypothetical protein
MTEVCVMIEQLLRTHLHSKKSGMRWVFVFKAIGIFGILLIIVTGCKKAGPLEGNGNNHKNNCIPCIQPGTLQSLDFEDKFAIRMAVEGNYLYVCAASNGLWRKNITKTCGWEYLGLADTSLGRYTNVGVLDVDVKGDEILVAYNGGAPHILPESTIGIWRSTNSGKNWFRSDSGIPETIDFGLECNIITGIQRSPHKQEIILADAGFAATYRSTSNGYSWLLLRGRRGVLLYTGGLAWHPYKKGEVWFFGGTSTFAPYLCVINDFGENFKSCVDFIKLGYPSDGIVSDVAFDVGDSNVVYASTSEGLIKTTDGGFTWRTNIRPDTGFVYCILEDPRRSGILYLGGGKRIYYSSDSAQTIKTIEKINTDWISSLALDTTTNLLFIGTTKGVYSLKVVCN